MTTEYNQDRLNERFDRESKSWRERYEAVEDSKWKYNDKLYRRHYCLELIGESKGGLALDLGCGAGPYVGSLNRLGFQVVAMDAAAEMVQLAGEETGKLEGNGLTVRGDALNLPFADDSFDSLLAVGLLEYLPDDREFLEKIGRVLKPGGRAIVTLRNERCRERSLWRFYKKCGIDIYRANYWYREHVPADFESLLGELGFTNIERRYCHFYPMTWPFYRIFRPINAVLANRMEEKYSRSENDRLASTYVVAFEKAGALPEPQPLDEDGFIDRLQCPISFGKLSRATAEQLERINATIAAGDAKMQGGDAVTQSLEQALVSADGKWLYAFAGKVPVLVADRALANPGAS